MSAKRHAQLKASGWRVGTAAVFLKMSEAEAQLVEMRLALSDLLRSRRTKQRLTQTALARRIGSSQSRVAKMELGDPTVSLDLLIRALLLVGASRRDLASAIGRRVA